MASPILVDHFLRQYAFKVTNSLLAIAEDDQDTYAIDPINVAEFWYKHAETDEARDKATAAIASMLSAINTVGDATEIIIDWEQIKILVEIIQSSPTALTDDELLAKPEYAVLFDVGDDGRLIGNDDVKAQCQRKARQWGRILGESRIFPTYRTIDCPSLVFLIPSRTSVDRRIRPQDPWQL